MPTISAPPFRQERKWFVSYVIKPGHGYMSDAEYHSTTVNIHPALWEVERNENARVGEVFVVLFYDELPADVSAQL